MGAYKTSSKQLHLLGLQDFKWQRLFHDHIIRNEE
jgi:putative transposase